MATPIPIHSGTSIEAKRKAFPGWPDWALGLISSVAGPGSPCDWAITYVFSEEGDFDTKCLDVSRDFKVWEPRLRFSKPGAPVGLQSDEANRESRQLPLPGLEAPAEIEVEPVPAPILYPQVESLPEEEQTRAFEFPNLVPRFD